MDTEETAMKEDLPLSWADVSMTNPEIQRLDRQFVAKDVTILYAATLCLVVMVWALIVTVFAVDDLEVAQRTIVTVFALSMIVTTIAVTIRRLWILKYYMVHPAIRMMSLSNAANRAVTSMGDEAVGEKMLAYMAISFVLSMFTFVSGGMCLLVGDNSVQAAGIGLSVATTFLLIYAGVFYRFHAGVFLLRVKQRFT